MSDAKSYSEMMLKNVDDTLRYFLEDERYENYRDENLKGVWLVSNKDTKDLLHCLYNVVNHNTHSEFSVIANSRNDAVIAAQEWESYSSQVDNEEDLLLKNYDAFAIDYTSLIVESENGYKNKTLYFGKMDGDIITSNEICKIVRIVYGLVIDPTDVEKIRSYAKEFKYITKEIPHPSIQLLVNRGFIESAARLYQDFHPNCSIENAISEVSSLQIIRITTKRILHRYYHDKEFSLYIKDENGRLVLIKNTAESAILRLIHQGTIVVAGKKHKEMTK